MIIAIDGPAGSGKGTVSKELSKKLGFINLDTGITYRCLALEVLRKNINLNDKKSIEDLSNKIKIEIINDNVFLNKEDVTDLIRSKEVTNIVSEISSIIKVRKNMNEIQRNFAKNKNVVVDGRDTTTVVFKNADFKFYLDASLEERAKRRYKQLKAKNINISLEDVKENIIKRDYNDTHKEYGALLRDNSQIYIDSSNMSINEVVDKIYNIVKDRVR